MAAAGAPQMAAEEDEEDGPPGLASAGEDQEGVESYHSDSKPWGRLGGTWVWECNGGRRATWGTWGTSSLLHHGLIRDGCAGCCSRGPLHECAEASL